MGKQCGFCGKPIEKFNRSTKKYCNDNCKQLAFYSRHGKGWGNHVLSKTISSPENLSFSVKPDFTLNGKTDDRSDVLQQIALTQADEVQQQPKKTSPIVKDFTVKEKNENQSYTVQQKNDDESTKKETEPPSSALSVKPKNIIPKNTKQEFIPKYQWVDSALLEAIENYRTQSDAEYMFCNPEQTWGKENVSVVEWVSIRFRCLVENIIRLSNYRFIDRATLIEISRAFNELTDSCYFQAILKYYPFSALIIELRDRFSESVKQTHTDEIPLRLSFKRKAELIAVRFMIGNFVPKKSFSQFKFGDGIREEVARKYREQQEK